MLATFLLDPIALGGFQKALLIVPLSLAISIVYKSTRAGNLSNLTRQAVGLCVTIVVGMYAVGMGLWALYHILA